MYDLHLHTNNSDGLDSWQTILQKAEAAKLTLISITDHDNCDAYFQMEEAGVFDPRHPGLDPGSGFFSGKLLTGIELQAYFKGLSIEILGYGFDIYKMRDSLQGLYLPMDELNRLVLETTCKKLTSMGITLPADVIENYDSTLHYYSMDYLHAQMRKFPENRIYIPDAESWEKDNIFFRRHISNPNSPFYIDESDVVPPAEKIIGIIRAAGGKAVLPHVYQYDENSELILHGLLDKLDGIECFYPSFTVAQSDYLLGLCKKHNLLITGGSDYHGEKRPNKMGCFRLP